jgi:hypothetical protein
MVALSHIKHTTNVYDTTFANAYSLSSAAYFTLIREKQPIFSYPKRYEIDP